MSPQASCRAVSQVNKNRLNNLSYRLNSTLSRNKSRQVFLAECFSEITTMLNSNENNIDLQQKIENYLFEVQNIYNSENLKSNRINFGEKTYKFIFDKTILIEEHLTNHIKNYNVDKDINKLNFKEKVVHYHHQIVSKIGATKMSGFLMHIVLDLISKESNQGNLLQINIFNSFGNSLINRYIFLLYCEHVKYTTKNGQEKLTLSEWKKLNKKIYEHIIDNEIVVGIGGNAISFLTSSSIDILQFVVKYDDGGDLHNMIEIVDNVRKSVISSNKVGVIPFKLPMISKPKPYKLKENGDVKLGGYLNNDVLFTRELFIDKIGYRDNTKLLANNMIIDLINGVSSVAYKINIETLRYIMFNGLSKNIIINPEDDDIKDFNLNPYKKISKKIKRDVKSKLSKVQLENYIINIAQAYSSTPEIYFPVRLDQRTRIYCETDFLNYQSNDLAKSLLSFVNGGALYKHDIEAINYFKSYGAILFNGTMDKRSISHRVKWVDKNKDYILDFENNDIVDKSDSKACFVSFCFEYKRFIKFIENMEATKFLTNLPIQLDASCNGYQHISLLTKQRDLFKELNLAPSKINEDPHDFYTFILLKIQNAISNKLKCNDYKDDSEMESLNRLSNIKLTRKNIKQPVMTKSYSAQTLSTADYFKNTLVRGEIHSKNLNKKTGEYAEEVYSASKDSLDTYITNDDVFLFLRIFNSVLMDVFPRYNILKKYTQGIVRIFVKLKIPIPWTLPSGAIVSHSYLNSKEKRLIPFSFMNSTFTFRSFIKDDFDMTKQRNAIMPNLIHSLDASSIAILYHYLKKDKICDIYTIHDCFAVTADNVVRLINNLKSVYLYIYTGHDYIITLDNNIKSTIINIFGKEKFSPDHKYVYIKNKDEEKLKKVLYPYKEIESLTKHNPCIRGLKESSSILI